jgi:hypothetical protein
MAWIAQAPHRRCHIAIPESHLPDAKTWPVANLPICHAHCFTHCPFIRPIHELMILREPLYTVPLRVAVSIQGTRLPYPAWSSPGRRSNCRLMSLDTHNWRGQ